MEITEKQKIYRDFWTNSAVVWFTDGVVAPIAAAYNHTIAILTSIVSIALGYLAIKFAEKAIEK